MHSIFQIILFVAFVVAITYRIINYWQERSYRAAIKKGTPIKPTTEEQRIERQKELQLKIKEQFEAYYQNILGDKDFINKETSSLEDFIINENLNYYDLHKLAYLNGIKVEMAGGWTKLTLDLMRKLDKTGWNRKVSSIKEKYGELRFYAHSNQIELMDQYTELSKTICEICGESGELVSHGYWLQTLCKNHQGEDVEKE